MTTVADGMLIKLNDLYGVDTIGDGYMEWVADNGPDWDSIVDFIESETSLPFVDGWHAYWTDTAPPVGVPRLLLESGDYLLLESGDKLELE